MWCVKIGLYLGFGSTVGPDYLQHTPPRNARYHALFIVMFRLMPFSAAKSSFPALNPSKLCPKKVAAA